MKTNNCQHPRSKTVALLSLAGLMMSLSSFTHEGSQLVAKNATHQHDVYKTGKKNTVKIFTKGKSTVHVVAVKNAGKQLDFFMFDTEGELVQNYRLIGNEEVVFNNMKVGSYTYRAFAGDEETVAGVIDLK